MRSCGPRLRSCGPRLPGQEDHAPKLCQVRVVRAVRVRCIVPLRSPLLVDLPHGVQPLRTNSGHRRTVEEIRAVWTRAAAIMRARGQMRTCPRARPGSPR